MRSFRWSLLAGSLLACLASPARAETPAPPAGAKVVLFDRVVVRWHAPETGGPANPQFIFERELAFEARLEAFADAEPAPRGYLERHVRAALDVHIGESLLATLPITPEPDPRTIATRAEVMRAILEQRAHGRDRLLEAAAAEGIGSDELDALLRRKARASLYVERMIAPMLEPSELELRDLWRTGTTPFSDQPFDRAQPALKVWYVGRRVSEAVLAHYQNSRSRVVISVARRAK